MTLNTHERTEIYKFLLNHGEYFWDSSGFYRAFGGIKIRGVLSDRAVVKEFRVLARGSTDRRIIKLLRGLRSERRLCACCGEEFGLYYKRKYCSVRCGNRMAKRRERGKV